MRQVLRLADADEVAMAACDRIVESAARSIASHGRFTLVLAGGSTPRRTYGLLAAGGDPPFRDRIDWSRTWVFFGDERPVPPTDPHSNFRMASDALLDRVPIPPSNVVRFVTERGAPHEVAARYEEQTRQILSLGPDVLPRFDLVLLGMGADGHTASLFPGSAALLERRRMAVDVDVEALATTRFTLTLATINHAAAILFLVTGSDKASTVRAVLHDPAGSLPASLVRPTDGTTTWLLDDAAGGGLS